MFNIKISLPHQARPTLGVELVSGVWMVWKECVEGLTWLKARRFPPGLEGFVSLLEFGAVLCIVQVYNVLRSRVLSSDIQSASEQMPSNGLRSVLFVPRIATYLF